MPPLSRWNPVAFLQENASRVLPRTFCVYPFVHLHIDPDAKARLCCRTPATIDDDHGQARSLHTASVAAIRNSGFMRTVRRRMLTGRRVDACAGCYQVEAEGGRSLRQEANSCLHRLLGAAWSACSSTLGRSPVLPPTSVHLWLGNLCNLSCRMCSGVFSTRIAADPVHARWLGHVVRRTTCLPVAPNGPSWQGLGLAELRDGRPAWRVDPETGASVAMASRAGALESIEIAGNSEGANELSVALGKIVLARLALDATAWTVVVKPDRPLGEQAGQRLSLRLARRESAVHLKRVVIETRAPFARQDPPGHVLPTPETPSWAEARNGLLEEVFAHPERLRYVNLAGGEPLINPRLPEILEMLVCSGRAARIQLFVSSNGTVHSDDLVRQLKQFRKPEIAVSLDGVGALHDYIRPPSRWPAVSANVLAFARSGIRTSVHPTPQAYNVFGLLDVVRFADQHDLPFVLNNVLGSPRHLSLDMLPAAVVEEACAEWLTYRSRECRPQHRSEVDTLVAALRRPRPADIGDLQGDFIRFTNDLDASRGQSLATACPRLHRSLVTAGLRFEGQRRFA